MMLELGEFIPAYYLGCFSQAMTMENTQIVGKPVGGKRRVFSFSESTPVKGLCKPLKINLFLLSSHPEFKKCFQTRFGTRGSEVQILSPRPFIFSHLQAFRSPEKSRR